MDDNIFTVDDGLTQVGSQLEDQEQLDTDAPWTYVDQKPFTSAGTIEAIEVVACQTGKPLKFGIYRPTTNKMQCSYRLMGELKISSLSRTGYHKVIIIYSS
jgi:hypothetical protein